ncbi:MAG TPA: gliding motility-associated C-terminal domain-containing protein [Bacteroidales bacterium]|nr:gliding motility-associated C-terminal domain-containing protein [Bacteroidales bacterium]
MTGIKYTIILFVGFYLSVSELIAQIPEPPVVHSVTIDPETGFTTIRWFPSSTPALVDYYLVQEVEGALARVISGPISPAVNSYEITSDDPHSRSMAYAVVAVNDIGIGPGQRSGWKADSTIFLQATFDSCLSSISLNWNDYNNWRGSIEEYRVYRWLDDDIYDLLTTLNEGTNSFEINNPQANQNYEIFIEAFHDDGRSSKSNKILIETQMVAVPTYINADYATISEGNGIDLSFTVGGLSGLTFYRLLRSNSFEGPYTAVDSFNTLENRILYTDDIDFLSGVYFYKLEVVNNCGLGAMQSNGANNIILHGVLSDLNTILEWNEYRDWHGNVADYRIVRTIGKQNPITDTIGITGNTVYNDDINDLVNYLDPAEGLICYSVVADENPNMFGLSGRSESNQVCFSVNPGVRIPNAFIPNDTEPENQVFEPVFSFLPDHYEILIYNRLGSKIWEGTQPWDGRVNGKYVPEGVYVYFIRVFNYSGEITEFNGRVTVIYR